jgi:integrase
MILDYREKRGVTCGPALLNMETGVLRRILKRGKLWYQFSDDIKPLKEPGTIGRALSSEQKATLIETAASRPEWETAFLASIIALSTTMRGCEVRGLRWQDIDLTGDPPTLTIHKSKTAAGERVIPLTSEAFEAFVKLRSRAELFGPTHPKHYVFARFRSVARFEGNIIAERRMLSFDPTTPLRSWKKAWRKLTDEAGLKGLRFHDCRHTTITDLLSNPNVSIQTAKAIAGHVSQRIIDRYSHIRMTEKRNAVEALSGNSVNTNNIREHVNTVNT